ncbi:interactor of constitutive active ROPs 2, chloroplastic-like [Durio zibethinus]|uniref:Interactor of constitutive active ROPs 2, chloroplastic-like n=1 Tax=Durio zibethinus TaxID=66656 RepID=A0A6P5Z203_DURZI|nr:interactor of constitutive active ROPs 2, chloroplastic-like [Durio zibethinus]XP_022746601.1 interactor of constitutive active ROPs 2, chloroplastic-like [Durio zibethinus]
MQMPKGRTSSLEVPQRKSPATPRTAHQLKIPGSDSDTVSSPNPASKTPKDRSPKVTERKALRSPVSEKKRPSRVTELEAQLTQLQDDLKKTRDQLTASDSWKRQAMQEAEEAKKQLSAMSVELEESEQQLLEISASEDERVQELRKISQDRDRAWQSELEAVQKQHSMDSAALASAMNEIQKLKVQLEKAYESEAIQTKDTESALTEIQNLRIELTETLSLVEKLKSELTDCRESESQALEVVSKTQMQLEAANNTIEILRSDATKGTEAYSIFSLELEQSKARFMSLEGLVSKLQAEPAGNSSKRFKDPEDDKLPQENGENEEIQQLKTELNFAKLEVGQLRSALDAAEIRYQEEYIQSTLQIRSAYEQVECIRMQSYQREVELEAEVKRTTADVEELRANLMDKETKLQSISEENKGLNLKIEKNHSNERESELAVELKKLEADLTELKASLTAKETELQSVNEQNEMFKMEIKKKEMENNKVSDESVALLEAARAAEREALMKLDYFTEEADKSSRRAACLTEQLDAAQAASTEKETELRRLKVQSDQWRKAAEAAASMLSTGNNGKHADRSISLDRNYNRTMGSPNLEDMDDDSPKKKNSNMLKKIGVLWKKGQK